MLLTSTSDVISLTSSASLNHDVYASYVDTTAGSTTVQPDRKNNLFTTAQTDTAVVPSPSASVFRIVKLLTVRNRDVSSANTITIKHYDGTNRPELFKATLQPLETLFFVEGYGFGVLDSSGRLKLRNDGLVGSASPSFTTVVLASDVTNNNASANTIADVTALSFAVTTGNTYWFKFLIAYTAAATTTGSRWSVNGPASPTLLLYKSEYSLSTTTRTINEGLNAYDSPAASSASSAATASNIAWIEGIIKPSANGTVIARFASEVSASAIVAKAGSICLWQQVI